MAKIIQLQAENIKRLKAVSITPDLEKGLVVIGGANEQGKTSVLDAISMAIKGGDVIPDKPIRKGSKKASTKIVLDNGLTIYRTFTENGTQLTIKDETGEKINSPQSILDKMMGKYTFDPVKFLTLKPTEQLDTLKRVVGLDFSSLDKERKSLYENRTLVNKELDNLRAKVKLMPVDKDVGNEEKSAAEVIQKLTEAKTFNASKTRLVEVLNISKSIFEKDKNELEKQQRRVEEIQNKIKELTAQLEVESKNVSLCKDNVAKSEAGVKKQEEEVNNFKEKDVSSLENELSNLENYNQKVRQNKERTKVIEEGRNKANESESLTKKIDAIDEKKTTLLSEAKFPVKGLAFDENGVIYNDLPFNQASSANQLRVSVAMAAAQNPELKVMLVKDGSLMDAKNLALLEELAKEHNLQVWVERVSEGDECSVVISDGEVVKEKGVSVEGKEAKENKSEKEEVSIEDIPF